MAKFTYYQDELVKSWRRNIFEVEAESKEEADRKIMELETGNLFLYEEEGEIDFVELAELPGSDEEVVHIEILDGDEYLMRDDEG